MKDHSLITYNYGTAMLAGFEWVLENDPDVFVIGQGLWSPWYVGNSMTDLDKKFGTHRIIDTPVSESAVTGAGVGAALAGKRPIVVHPRMDFMLYAMDSIINQAAKWHHMLGGNSGVPLTVRAIINRGGEQGAQHSQALQSWFAHVPGLRVVMPHSVADARDLLIASVLCNDPVIFIDDRWLYEKTDTLPPVEASPKRLEEYSPKVISDGKDITIVGSGYSSELALKANDALKEVGISAEIIDLRVLSPLNIEPIKNSVLKTGRLICVDGGWSPCGVSSEILASCVEKVAPITWKSRPQRITLPFAPAPSSSHLEQCYYPTEQDVVTLAKKLISE